MEKPEFATCECGNVFELTDDNCDVLDRALAAEEELARVRLLLRELKRWSPSTDEDWLGGTPFADALDLVLAEAY